MPRVTVVLPAYNEARALTNAVASVLGQTLGDLELLVVDDGSGEELGPALSRASADPRFRTIRHEKNHGAAAARNTGIKYSAGDYIAFLDSDDTWHPSKLERQLEWMTARGLPVSCTGFRIRTPFHPQGECRQPKPKIELHDLLWGCGLSPGSTMLIRRDVFEAVGPFDEALRRLEDWDWLLRCAHNLPVAVVPEVLASVESGPREDCPLSDVRESARLMRGYIASGRYNLSRRDKRRILSTLHAEVSASAFLRCQYSLAVATSIASLCYKPLRPVTYYRRVFHALKTDFVQWITRRNRLASKRPEQGMRDSDPR